MLSKKRMVPMALAVCALVMLAVASLANAGHMRPKAAGTIRVSLVPAFNACSPTGAPLLHGPPLGPVPSCVPVPSGTGAATGGADPPTTGAANMDNSYVLLKVVAGIPGPPEDSDVLITSNVNDVRCAVGATACGAANAVGQADYTGGLQGTAQIQITDHWNAPAPGGGPDPGTVVPLPFSVTYVSAGCVATAGDTSQGSLCTASTSANAAVPGAVKDGKRAVVETQTININDGGPDGVVSAGVSKFLTQGIFIP